jgi:hypothetical protein
MRKMILIAFAGLSLSACSWMEQGQPRAAAQNGPYDNTANSLDGWFAGGVAGPRLIPLPCSV